MSLNILFTQQGYNILQSLQRRYPWSSVYGTARTLLALGTLLTFLVNDTTILFKEGSGLPQRVFCSNASQLSLFCILPIEYLEVARWLSVGILLLVVIGWRPRITGLLHWYVSYSFFASSVLTDGGDQVTAVLTLLLLPITLTDSRKWHWQKAQEDPKTHQEAFTIKKMIALSAFIAIRLQIAIIYFHAGVAKLVVPEWSNGTALYYWFMSDYMGLPLHIRPILEPFLQSGFVALLTWSVIALEIFLAIALFLLATSLLKKYLYYLGLMFHIAIFFLMGISSFAIAMIAALILYLYPLQKEGFTGYYPTPTKVWKG